MQEEHQGKLRKNLRIFSLVFCVSGFIAHFLIYIVGSTLLLLIPLSLNGISVLLAGFTANLFHGVFRADKFINLFVIFCFFQQLVQYFFFKHSTKRLLYFVTMFLIVGIFNFTSGLIVFLMLSYLAGFS